MAREVADFVGVVRVVRDDALESVEVEERRDDADVAADNNDDVEAEQAEALEDAL